MKKSSNKAANFKFSTVTVDPKTLNVHEMLETLGYNFQPSQTFIESAKHFGFYKKPVVDNDNNVVFNSAEVLAAQKNEVRALQVFVCDMTAHELRRFIAFTHTYHKTDVVGTFNTIKFYESYFKTEEGILLYRSTEGKTTRDKIARLMHTCDGTIKRIKRIGELKPHKLGLIQEGELSYKEVLTEIKLEQMAKKQVNKKVEREDATSPDNITPGGQGETQSATRIIPLPTPMNERTTTEEEEITISDKPGRLIPIPSQSHTAPSLEIRKSSFDIKGLGVLSIDNTGKEPIVTLDGKSLGQTEFDSFTNPQAGQNSTVSFVFSVINGFTISISVENIQQAIRKAA
jgi:hypothetical protein